MSASQLSSALLFGRDKITVEFDLFVIITIVVFGKKYDGCLRWSRVRLPECSTDAYRLETWPCNVSGSDGQAEYLAPNECSEFIAN